MTSITPTHRHTLVSRYISDRWANRLSVKLEKGENREATRTQAKQYNKGDTYLRYTHCQLVSD